MFVLAVCRDAPDSIPLRATHMERHMEHVATNLDRFMFGMPLLAGDREEDVFGTLLCYEGKTAEEALRPSIEDPYSRFGAWDRVEACTIEDIRRVQAIAASERCFAALWRPDRKVDNNEADRALISFAPELNKELMLSARLGDAALPDAPVQHPIPRALMFFAADRPAVGKLELSDGWKVYGVPVLKGAWTDQHQPEMLLAGGK